MMNAIIEPSKACGVIAAPPSKSIAHRALICAALSDKSTVYDVDYSDDINATLKALKHLGAQVDICGTTVNIGGLNPRRIKGTTIDCKESGSTLRFLIPLCMLSGEEIVFTGAKRLFQRDLSVYKEIAVKQNIGFSLTGNKLIVKGKLKNDDFLINGDISSQFISGLMFALPFLEVESTIGFKTGLCSKPYVDMTVDVLSDFGIKIGKADNGYKLSGNQKFSDLEYRVEGDYSNAAFLDAFNLLGGNVEVKGLKENTLQGDSIYKEFFKRIKSGGIYDLSDCPDLAPVLFALSAHFSGGDFSGTKRLKIKESDRAAAMKTELEKFGAKVFVFDNEVLIKNTKLKSPEILLNSHNDHRIAMALSLLCSIYGGEIQDAQSVNKSYPKFFDDLKTLGIKVDLK